jgi:hypothetical protein
VAPESTKLEAETRKEICKIDVSFNAEDLVAAGEK